MTIIAQKTVFYVGHITPFCFESQGCFVFGNEAQGHANKGTQHIGGTPPAWKARVLKQEFCFKIQKVFIQFDENERKFLILIKVAQLNRVDENPKEQARVL